jgi:transcriptional regulator with XRE-family HTH domain
MFKRRYQPKETVETITAGYCLRRRRDEMQLSLKEIGQRLGIKEEYLNNLESGNYKDLPPQVYVRGFIKSYADLLGIDGGQLIKIYNREMSFLSEDAGEKPAENAAGKFDLRDYLVITPKLLTLAFSLVVLGGLGYYFYHQVNSFNSKPYLYVDSPASDEVVKEKDLLVQGKTEKDALLQINGQDVSVGGDGDFSQKVTLSAGRNHLLIEARNRFNKTDQRAMDIIYDEPPESATTITELSAEGTDTGTSAGVKGSDSATSPAIGTTKGAAVEKNTSPASGSSTDKKPATKSTTPTDTKKASSPAADVKPATLPAIDTAADGTGGTKPPALGATKVD